MKNSTNGDLLRYLLWLAVAETAYENRQLYHMATTWLPHLATNTLSLLLPDLFRLITPSESKIDDANGNNPTDIQMVEQAVIAMVRDNPNYAGYVAPLALGYILSHPRFNIYKGKMAELRIAGLGLDALPHAATAYGLVALVADTADTAEKIVPRKNKFRPLIDWVARHPGIFTGIVLTVVTLFWETSEYRVHQHELKLRGDITKINMQWSIEDTIRDCIANALGWLVAMVIRSWRR